MIRNSAFSLLIILFPALLFAQSKGATVDRSIQFLANMQQENFDANRVFMAKAYLNAEFPKKLSESWHFQTQQLGKYVGLKSTKYDLFRDYEIVYLSCEFEKSDYTLKLVYNKRGEITDVYYIPYPPLIPAGKLNTLWVIMFLIFWELAWKAMGLWKAGRNQQAVWFVSIFILPTAGLLPIFYTLFIKEKYKPANIASQ